MREIRTPTLTPLREGLPLVAGGHVQHVADEREALRAGREGTRRLLGEETVQKNDRHQDGGGVEEGRRVAHSSTQGWRGGGGEMRFAAHTTGSYIRAQEPSPRRVGAVRTREDEGGVGCGWVSG